MSATTVDERVMGKAFLALLGAPYSSRMVYAVIAWIRGETGHTVVGNNPWNHHVGPPCPANAPAAVNGIPHSQRLTGQPGGVIGNRYAGPVDQNVAIYGKASDGLRDSANLLLWGLTPGGAWTGYGPVVKAARLDDPRGFLDDLAASKWAADKYGTAHGGPNRLVGLYREIVAGLGPWYAI
jgi:hypothetical protein